MLNTDGPDSARQQQFWLTFIAYQFVQRLDLGSLLSMSGSGAEFTEMTGKVIKDAARLAKEGHAGLPIGRGIEAATGVLIWVSTQ